MDIHKVRAEILKSVKESMRQYDFGENASPMFRIIHVHKVEAVLSVGIRSGLISDALYHTIRRGFLDATKVNENEMYRMLTIIDWNLEHCEAGRSEVAGQ